jgi:hypothetical protein
MFKLFDKKFYDDQEQIGKNKKPAILPIDLDTINRMFDRVEAAHIQRLCTEEPEDFFKNIEVTFNQKPQNNNPSSSSMNIKQFFTDGEYLEKTKLKNTLAYIKVKAAKLAYLDVCLHVEEQYKEAGLYFYKEFHLAQKSCDIGNHQDIDAFLARVYGDEFVSRMNDEEETENDAYNGPD